jgi:LysR family hydrogen peroxide-inducible transcriptional activator
VVQEDTTAASARVFTDMRSISHGSQPIDDERLEVKELFAEELLLALPSTHPLARKRVVPSAGLQGQRFDRD